MFAHLLDLHACTDTLLSILSLSTCSGNTHLQHASLLFFSSVYVHVVFAYMCMFNVLVITPYYLFIMFISLFVDNNYLLMLLKYLFL